MLINGVYWEEGRPRLLTTQQLRNIQSNPACRYRMLSVADISCDVKGSLEFTSRMTNIESPFFYVDAVNGKEHKE
jgi:alpha-aminoadipic semialdehyde synthase